jgi:hypothetical protein
MFGNIPALGSSGEWVLDETPAADVMNVVNTVELNGVEIDGSVDGWVVIVD